MNNDQNNKAPHSTAQREAIQHLRSAIKTGHDWPQALLEAMALWTAPEEEFRGRRYRYFIGGEAFDWLLLAERLTKAVGGLIPDQDREDFLFTGRFPDSFDEAHFRDLLGVDKYRGYLNYFYGVTVEEALQLATEREVHKRHVANGSQYLDDFSEEAHVRIYREPQNTLLSRFRQENQYPSRPSMSLTESKEFTYWLFKYRLKMSDKAKIASDTWKGLQQLQQLASSQRARAAQYLKV